MILVKKLESKERKSNLNVNLIRITDAPQRISSEPVVTDGGKDWVSLRWGKPDQKGAAPVLGYRVDGWLAGGEGGARWIDLGYTPVNSFDVFDLKPEGEYLFRVIPRNRYGWGPSSQTSNSITIGRGSKPPEFLVHLPGKVKALLGDTLKLNCEITASASVSWFKDGLELETAERITIDRRGCECSFQLKDVQIEDTGRYSCEATYKGGTTATYARLAVVADKALLRADSEIKRSVMLM